jgi:23S rRNA (adenine2503-C2)-methyltransferase
VKENLRQYTLDGLRERMLREHLDAYRGEQIFKWLWQKNMSTFETMTNLSKELRIILSEKFTIGGLMIDHMVKGTDGTQKFRLRLQDEHCIEAVLIPEDRRQTICVSTQVGCPLACTFCATGLMGYVRDLKAFEIADQVRIIQEMVGRKISNVVFMGMGEPLLNTQNILDAMAILCSPMGLSISQRHMTVSTIGILPGLKALLASPLKVKLAISLNFPVQAQREEMMPGTKRHSLTSVLDLARQYSREKTMVTFEYVVIRKINDTIQHAQALLNLVKNIPSKINVIPYNPSPQLPYQAPGETSLMRFHDFLLASPHTITLRRSRGLDVHAACGQLVINPPQTKNE